MSDADFAAAVVEDCEVKETVMSKEVRVPLPKDGQVPCTSTSESSGRDSCHLGNLSL